MEKKKNKMMKMQKIYVPLEIDDREIQDTETLLRELTSQGWNMEGSVVLMTAVPTSKIKIEVLTRHKNE